MDIKSIKKFVELIEETDIVELRIDSRDLKFGIKKGQYPAAAKPKQNGIGNNKNGKPISLKKQEEYVPDKTNGVQPLVIKSTMVGTFYYSPSPDEPAYIKLGDKVKVGQKIGVIEAMKIMKEVTSPCEGRVVEMLIQNGRPVEYGQDIIYLEPVKK